MASTIGASGKPPRGEIQPGMEQMAGTRQSFARSRLSGSPLDARRFAPRSAHRLSWLRSYWSSSGSLNQAAFEKGQTTLISPSKGTWLLTTFLW